ncbi:MAG: F0F1 ATP synthase subunit epsilon [Litoreibacter sp.]
MADTMQFDLVSPERSLASAQATEVRIPGAEGDLTAMADHAPVITTLRPGVLTVVNNDGEQDFLVVGGFAEVSPAGTSVLAERAYAKADVTREILDGLVADATAARDNASAEGADLAAKFLADIQAAGAQLGL